jgi:hypothetical protein
LSAGRPSLKDRLRSLSPEQRRRLAERLARPARVVRSGETARFPLSFGQERLWFLSRLEPANPFYNEPLIAVRLRGPLDTGALRRAFAAVGERHEILRTRFPVDAEGLPVQEVCAGSPIDMREIDLAALPAADREARLADLARAEGARAFDLAAGPLIVPSLVRLGPREHALLVAQHHIVTDGWSRRILVGEVAACYRAHARGVDPGLAPLPMQYGDFAAWQRAFVSGERRARLVRYWTDRLGQPPPLRLPTERPRRARLRYEGGLHVATVPRALAERVRERAARAGATSFHLLLACFVGLLYRLTGQRDVVVGIPVANRSRSELEPLIGFFTNTLLLRTRVEPGEPVTALLASVRDSVLGALENQDLPFEVLVRELRPERSLSHLPLLGAMFVMHNYPVGLPALADGELAVEPLGVAEGGDEAKVDLALAVTDPPGQGMLLQLYFSSWLFSATAMRALLDRYARFLEAACGADDPPIGALLRDATPAPRPADAVSRASTTTPG